VAFGILIAIFLGIFFGIFTGLIPGIHINLVALGLVTFASTLLRFFSPLDVAAFIVAMGVTHTFLDVLPSVFLGAPSSDTALLTLPAHRLLNLGKGYDAVKLATIGGLASTIFLVGLSPLLYLFIKWLYPLMEWAIGYALAAYIVFFILRNSTMQKRFSALIVMALSGSLGLLVLNTPIFRQPMFPLLTGFFGTSLLLTSLFESNKPPKQEMKSEVFLPNPSLIKGVLGASFGGIVTGILPGVGAAQAAIIGRGVIRNLDKIGFVVLVGGVNNVNFFVSLFTLHTVGKARNGAVLALQEFIPKLSLQHLVLLVMVSMLAAGIASLLSLVFAQWFCRLVSRFDYRKLSIGVMAVLIIFTLGFSGLLGLCVLITSTAIGLIPNYTGIGKSNCMGCIMVPVVAYFLF
jgi:putative membrane protein